MLTENSVIYPRRNVLISTDNIKDLKRSPDKVNINDLIRTAGMGNGTGMFQNYLGKTTAF